MSTRLRTAIVVGLGAFVLGGVTSGYAATSLITGQGTMALYEPFDGPATMTARRFLINANETLPWHYHPGIGAMTIVKEGTLTVEDGCGGEIVYPAGTAFIEPPNHVHRGIAGNTPVETVQTFLVPQGSAFSVSLAAQECGAPLEKVECKGNGWEAFTYPRIFENQGDCVDFVINGES